MKVIYKYNILHHTEFELSMPKGGKILNVQVQHGIPCIWALIDVEAKEEQRRFKVYMTGDPREDIKGKYIGTYQLQGGNFVGHLFEEESNVKRD